ncbi:PQQ-dependent sugar dehydrogenase [Lacibacterium aquatile]|uniref:PQQ-dependent sugar dehydrogenase n=1 Tax=Lacibacterium aquatile TaxID=1168082 RepID=A0ABW5DKP9_9PROT
MKQHLVPSALYLALAAALAGPALAQEAPGTAITVNPRELPAPYATPSATNGPRIIPRPSGAGLQVPENFKAQVFADNMLHPRNIAIAPDGAVMVAESTAGQISILRDENGDGRADRANAFMTGLNRPFGMAFQGNTLYVADTEGVWRASYRAGQQAPTSPPQRITASGALGSGTGHSTRSLAFNATGDRFYVGVGSRSNVEEEEAPRASIISFAADGSDRRLVASGLRNPVGMAIYPETDRLWTVVNERDGLGDGLVPDYLTQVAPGAFYGWPYAYLGPNPQPGFAERRPDLVAKTQMPDLLFRAHSAPIGLVFYDARMFPAEMRGDAFVALRGSWNAGSPRGYQIVRVPFANGRPKGGYEVFASGFRTGGTERAEVWGRPAGLAVAADGALLIADDTSRTIWRVSYTAPARRN